MFPTVRMGGRTLSISFGIEGITPSEGVPVKRISVVKKQKGQALIASVFFAMVAMMGLVMMYNTSQTATEKTKLVNAADAAAYSGAVFVPGRHRWRSASRV